MTNEEKARKLQLDCVENGCGDSTDIRCACEEMAEWKDKQFKEYLEKKNTEINNTKAKIDKTTTDYMLCTLKSLFIDEIINELFPEPKEQDNSDNDE